VISPARPDPRQNVSFVNRSRDGSGTPTEGSLVVVADNNPFNPNTFDDLAPQQRATVNGMPPGDWRVTMRAGTGASESSVTRNFKVSPDPTKLTFTGPTSGIAGTDVVLTARLNVVRSGDPAYDAWVDFRLGDLTAGGTTAVDGTAGARITLPRTPGTYPVRVSFAGDDRFGPTETTATVEVRPRPASAGTISTFAGAWTGPTPATSMGSTGTGQVPAAVAVHGKTVYVADAQANQIKAIDLERKLARLIAGNGTRGGSGDGGPARRAQLALPQDVGEGTGLAVDGAGNVYVSDTDNHRVRRVRPGGSITPVAGTGRPGFGGDGGPATDARLNRPRGLTFDAAGRLYIADSANKRIRRVDATGRISTLATLSRDPKGVAVRPNGNVLVAPGPSEEPFRWTSVLEVDPAGAVSKFVGGARAELQDPVALATDGAGNVYVTDTERDRIRVVDPSGSVRTWAGVVHFPPEPRHGKGWFDDPNGIAPGEGYASEAYLNHPAGVAFDAEGNGYIADRGNHRVRMVTPFGVISTIASGGSIIGSGGSCCVTEWLSARQAQLGRPGGLAVAPDGSVAIVDQDNFSLHIVDRGGWMRRLAGVDKREECQCQNGIFATNAEYAKFENVTSVAAEPGGRRFYFSEYASATDPPTTTDYEGYVHHVRFDQGAIIPVVRGVAGNLPPWYGGGGPATQESLFRPQGVALDPAGNLYIAETARHRVRKVSPDGTIATVAGQGTEGSGGDGGPATAAHLRFPEDVDVDAAGALYIADTGNHKVRKVAPDGRISTVAGTGRPGFDGDGGDAKDARLNEPSDLSVDADGSLYVTDRRNHRLRLITPRGTILTIAGTGLPGIGGQGGLPTGARLQAPDGVALDRAGGVLVSAGPRVWRLPAPAGPTVYASDVRVREGDSGSPKAKVTISLLESAGQATSVAFSTIAAAARAPADFAPKAGTVRFRPGELSTSLTLDVVGDLSPERNEGFEVRFSAPAGGAAIGDAAARVTIVDDD
jgi:sugar lactone lactonase YvrE